MIQVIGARVKALREERGISQGLLASRTGLTRSQICRVEKDERPGVQAVAVGQIAAALDTTADYLLGLTADPLPRPPVEWQTDPAHLARVQELLDRLMRLPRDRQDRVLRAVLTLMEVSEVVNGLDVKADQVLRRDAAAGEPGDR